MQPYVVDTSAWIELWKRYPPRVFPSIWSQLKALCANGRLVSPEEVRYELEDIERDDGLAEYLKAWPGLFWPLDNQLQAAVLDVNNHIEGLTDADSEKDRADSFVVGLAVMASGTVVTQERRRRGPTGRPRIPDAADHFGLTTISALDLIERLGLQL